MTPRSTSSPPTLLTVNDYAPGRYATCRTLRDAGFRVLEASTGAEALSIAEAEKPDLVLLDINLPDIDGFEVCRRLRANPRTATVAILQTSASYVERTDRIRGLEGGADAYLIEPIERDELLATVGALLRLHDAEHALRCAADEWHLTFDAISDPIALIAGAGKVERSNRSFDALFGGGASAVGRDFTGLLAAASADAGERDALLTALTAGDQADVPVKIGERWFRARFDALDSEGNNATVVVLRDETDRRRAEEVRIRFLQYERGARELAEASKARFELLSDVSRLLDASLLDEQNLSGVARLVASRFADVCFIDLIGAGGVLELAAAESVHGTISEEERRRHAEIVASDPSGCVARTLDSGEAIVHPAEGLRDSLCAPFMHGGLQTLIAAPLQARGRSLGVVFFGRGGDRPPFAAEDAEYACDLTGRLALSIDNARLYRDAQRANRAKDDFLATLSHELRTPLTATLGWIRLLKSDEVDPAMRQEAFATVERSSVQQAEIIEDILDASRIVTGRLKIASEDVRLDEIVRRVVERLRPSAEIKDIRLAVAIGETPAISGDPARLEQVARNIIGNAIKFTPPGGNVKVAVSSDEECVALVVTDDGQGMSADFLPSLFERFQQEDSASNRLHGGLGLGLAIARHVVELHGGTVVAESTGEGSGATFRIRIPFASAELAEGLEGTPSVA
jgi:signal transduction histidine kinase/DNA-binding response OmpR family regulator